MVDWTKPIQMRNGERLELIETHPNGSPNFPDCTRIVRRLDVDTSTEGGVMSSIWWYREDGSSGLPGYEVVNVNEQIASQVGTNWKLSEQTKREIDEINKNSMQAAAMAKDVKFD